MALGDQTYVVVELDVHQDIGGAVELQTYRFCPVASLPPDGSMGARWIARLRRCDRRAAGTLSLLVQRR